MTLKLPIGFRFSGCHSGIKNAADTKDISLVVSDSEATAAGVYTQNQVVAAPVVNCQAKTPSSRARAVIVNSGNANACTGQRGIEDADTMCSLTAEHVARKLDIAINEKQVFVMSTGVIGHHLPMEKVSAGIQTAAAQLKDSDDGFLAAADGILTTDKARKVGSRTLNVGSREVQIVGMAKGAGMIGPNMATMLCTILTDAALEPEQAQRLLQIAADHSFNNISVEGHTSTNDTMLLMANGMSRVRIAKTEEAEFQRALTDLSIELAKLIPMDGEGASHLIEISVMGAANDSAARAIADAVAGSNLVKTAIFGNDPNWGRIISAAGYAGPQLDLAQLELTLNGFCLYQAGEPKNVDEAQVSHSIRENTTTEIHLCVGGGSGRCTHWTSDLTLEYVSFNSEYTT